MPVTEGYYDQEIQLHGVVPSDHCAAISSLFLTFLNFRVDNENQKTQLTRYNNE